ncbi:MAG: SpoIIE family protein phosphatase [Candidatus Promineifilaceae bacterium]
MSVGTTSIFRNVFRGLNEDGLDDLRQVAQMHTYPAQTILIRQGDMGSTLFVIVEGRVAVTQKLDDGQERLLGIRGPREFFGELSLLDETPRMASCVTLIETRVLEVTEETFDKVLENSPTVAYAIMRHVVEMLRENDRTSINGLVAKNKQLQEAYEELKMAQASIVEKERMERELEIAAEVQRSILPGKLPQYPDYHFSAFLQPARRVGGDLYNVIDLDKDHTGLLIADVADKSVQAALYMAVTTTLFQVESKHFLTPAKVAEAVHQGLMEISSEANIFVTAFYGVLHRPSGKLTYVLAGHERPFLLRGSEAVVTLSGEGRFLGMINPLVLHEYTVELNPGDKLLLYSDGAVDAENQEHEQLGYERLVALLEKNRTLPIDRLIAAMASEITAWSGQMSAFDDLTLVGLEVINN